MVHVLPQWVSDPGYSRGLSLDLVCSWTTLMTPKKLWQHQQDYLLMTQHCIESCLSAMTRNNCSKILTVPQLGRAVGRWSSIMKTKRLGVYRKRSPLQCTYNIYRHFIDTVSSTKYLGVTICSDLTWDEHTKNVVNKANMILGFLRRNLKISSKHPKQQAYKAYVANIAVSVRDPYNKVRSSSKKSS